MSIREIIPLLAAVIGLTPVILKWLNDRSKEAANRRYIQQAKEQVEFWQAWLQAQREVSSDEQFTVLKRTTAKQLDKLMQTVTKQNYHETSSEQSKNGPSFFQRLFLIYFPQTFAGWIFHSLFYITISFTIMFLFGSSLPEDDINANPSWDVFVSDIGLIIFVLLVFITIAFIFQRLANRADRKYREKLNEPEKE